MKIPHDSPAHSDLAPAERPPRRARVACSALFVIAFAGSMLDIAQNERVIPHSEYVAPPRLRSAELIRFAEVERALEGLQLDPSGRLTLDADLESALAQATTHLSFDAARDAVSLERHRFLIRKALPDPAGSEFADALIAYARYRHAAAELLDPTEPATLASEAHRLAQLREIRREHFDPEIAEAMFGKEERLAQYMLELRRVEEDSTLSARQRELATAELQRAYEAHTSETP